MVNGLAKRSDVLLGVVVIVAVVLSVVLFMSQFWGSDNPNGPGDSSLIEISDLAKDAESLNLIVYIGNIGDDVADLSSGYGVRVNDVDIPFFEGVLDRSVLDPGQVATANVPFRGTSGMSLVVRIVRNDVVLDEMIVDDSDSLQIAYNLLVNIIGDSSNKVAKIPDQSSYPSGTAVSLIAESAEGWVFSEWRGAVTGSNNPSSLIIDSNKIVNAYFEEGDTPSPTPTPTITPTPTPTPDNAVDVTFTQSGLDSSATGTVLNVQGSSKAYGDFPFTLSVNKGSLVSYDFSDLVESSSSGKQFVLSSVTGPNSPISATSDITVVANFDTQYEVSFSLSPENAEASIQPEGAQWFDSGEQVSITTETSSSSYVFLQWETSNQFNQIENINSQSTSVTINGPGEITAVYSLVQLQVSFVQNGIDNPGVQTTVTYRINGGTEIEETVPFEVTVDHGDTITYSYRETITVISFNERYQLAETSPSSPVTVTDDIQIVGNYDLQYFMIFDENGLDNSAQGTVLIIGGEEKTYSDLPIIDWFNRGTTYRYTLTVSGGANKQFILLDPVGPRIINSAESVDGNYKVQYYFEVNSPVGNPTGQGWYDSGATVISNSGSPIPPSGSPQVGYLATGYTGTGSLSNGVGTTATFTIDEPSSITWRWEGTLILYPDGDLSPQTLDSSGYSEHWGCVQDYSNPDGANYVYAENDSPLPIFDPDPTWYEDYYSFENVGSIMGSIDSVVVNARWRSSGGDSKGRIYVRLPGSYSDQSSNLSLMPSWFTDNFSPKRPSGGWDWTDINNLEVGVGLQTNTDLFARCTLVWVEVTFNV